MNIEAVVAAFLAVRWMMIPALLLFYHKEDLRIFFFFSASTRGEEYVFCD